MKQYSWHNEMKLLHSIRATVSLAAAPHVFVIRDFSFHPPRRDPTPDSPLQQWRVNTGQVTRALAGSPAAALISL